MGTKCIDCEREHAKHARQPKEGDIYSRRDSYGGEDILMLTQVEADIYLFIGTDGNRWENEKIKRSDLAKYIKANGLVFVRFGGWQV